MIRSAVATFDGRGGAMKPEGRRRCETIRLSFEAVKERVVELRSRRAILFVGPAHDDPERIIRQWPLQHLASSHGARIQPSRSSSVSRITCMAFGWIGSTTAFGDVVKQSSRR